jgi:hypothetical protein
MVPPGLHWALVLVYEYLTLGIFYVVWMFKQANFVQRIDPQGTGRKLLNIVLLLWAGIVVAAIIVATTTPQPSAATGPVDPRNRGVNFYVAPFVGLAALATPVLMIVAQFKMRRSLLTYYNTVEPIQLRLSGLMTLLFNILYFQYHFRRIREWKLTGRLRPQR